MALSPKIITGNTPFAAVAMLAILLGTTWAVIEFAPRHDMPTKVSAPHPAYERSSAPHYAFDVAFHPTERPDDPGLCEWTADQVFLHFDPLSDGDRVEFHTRGIAGLVEAYIDLGCPAAIHDGDWHATTQILGVGLVYESLREQSEIYDSSIDWDPRADQLVRVATTTYDVLSPTRMCEQASREHAGLVPHCTSAFGR